MTSLIRFLAPCISWLPLFLFAANAAAAEMNGVSFDPSPPGDWRCGLTNDDLPGLAAERMRQPVASGCTRGDAKAYAVIVDLSDARYAMSAEQMAADSEDQLPSSWKIDTKFYDVVSTPTGQPAAYSRLVGKGDGFTFLSGQTPMVAISVNVPLIFEDEPGTPRQAIAVFRVRSPIPAGTGQRKTIDELDQALRAWAGTAHPTSNRPISARDFELAAHAGASGAAPVAASSKAPEARPERGGAERISAALAAAVQGRATESDLAVLGDAEKQFGRKALGVMAQSLSDDIQRSSLDQQQQKILSAAIESGDSGAAASAVNVSENRGWPLRNLSPAAAAAVAAAVLKRSAPFITPAKDRAFLEFPSDELLTLVLHARSAPLIGDVARRERDHWRMKDRRNASRTAYVVQSEKSLGILERQQATDVYLYRPLTNLLDVAAVDP